MKAILGILMLMTMACAPVTPSAGGEEPAPDQSPLNLVCKADAARSLIGKERSEAVGADARRLTGARTIRWIRPGDAVSMDYRTDRLNIHLDGRGRVERIDCG